MNDMSAVCFLTAGLPLRKFCTAQDKAGNSNNIAAYKLLLKDMLFGKINILELSSNFSFNLVHGIKSV